MFRLFKCTRAVVTIELAIIIPILWTFLAGSFSLVNFIYTIFEVDNAAITAANVISQIPSANYTVADITALLRNINSASQPINVIGPVTAAGTGQGAVIVSIVTMANATKANPNPVPQVAWQCVATSLTTNVPASHVGKPTNQPVAATLPPPGPGFQQLVLNGGDSAVIAEAFYSYTPFVFGTTTFGFGNLFGFGTRQLYHEAIFAPRLASLSVPTNGAIGSKTISPTNNASC